MMPRVSLSPYPFNFYIGNADAARIEAHMQAYMLNGIGLR